LNDRGTTSFLCSLLSRNAGHFKQKRDGVIPYAFGAPTVPPGIVDDVNDSTATGPRSLAHVHAASSVVTDIDRLNGSDKLHQ